MIGSVLVIYMPNDEKIIKNLKILSEQCDFIYIHINSEISKKLKHFLDNMNNVEIVFSKKNLGLGKSQNDGIDFFLKKESFKSIIFFDQDTKLTNNSIQNMHSLVRSLQSSKNKIGAIAPILMNSYSNSAYKKYKKIKNFQDFCEVREVMLSGMIVPISTFSIVGKFREDFFMDLIDFEWCWRARSFGFKIFQSKKALAYHSLGEGDKNFFGINISIPKPERITTQLRNFRKVLKLQHTPKIWILINYLKYFIKFFYYSYFLEDGKKFKHHFILGLKEDVKKNK